MKLMKNIHLSKKMTKFVIPCSQDGVEGWLKNCVYYAKGSPSLIILDDCASGKSVKNRTSELVKLGFSARHNISVIVVTQQLTSIAKPFRENISKLVTFYNPNKRDIKIVTQDYLGEISKEELTKVLCTLKEKQYSNLEINLIFPFTCKINVLKSLKEKFWIKISEKNFLKKYPNTDMTKFYFEHDINKDGSWEKTTYFKNSPTVSTDIESDTFKNDSEMTKYLTINKPKENFPKIWKLGGEIQKLPRGKRHVGFYGKSYYWDEFPVEYILNYPIHQFRIYVNDTDYFPSNLPPSYITTDQNA